MAPRNRATANHYGPQLYPCQNPTTPNSILVFLIKSVPLFWFSLFVQLKAGSINLFNQQVRERVNLIS